MLSYPPEQIFLKYLSPLWEICSHWPATWRQISAY